MTSASHDDGLNWADLSPVAFDFAKARDSKSRQFAREAAGTLFPLLMPEPGRKTAGKTAELPGQGDLFGGVL